ncbi:hypothetical protein DFH08DRAFT_907575, partial [Mycena albidolilacea]
MDNQPHESADSTTNSTPPNLESHSQGSVMFSGNQAFTVNGGTFTNVTNQCPARVPSDFRMIPLGDIDLRHEIQVDRGVIGRRRGQGCIRRVYSAKVQSRKSDFTVAMYQGNGAEEDWRQAIAEHVSIRQVSSSVSVSALTTDSAIPILFRFMGQYIQAVYMLHSIMTSLCRFINSWTVIDIRTSKQYISMHAV